MMTLSHKPVLNLQSYEICDEESLGGFAVKYDDEKQQCINHNTKHRIKDMHDNKNDCCIICNKVFNKKTGKLVGYSSVEWQ